MSIQAPRSGLRFRHFALIYLNERGELGFETSPSIASSSDGILSPEIRERFLQAVALSNSVRMPNDGHAPSQSALVSSERKDINHGTVASTLLDHSEQLEIPVYNSKMLRLYYEKAFEALQQTNCRVLAKAYIKLVEPRKQVNFPYNGRRVISGLSRQLDPEETKPGWWPTGVPHREPDHLLKPERIRLLVHILCDLRESHGMSVQKLWEADQAIRYQFDPSERLRLLDEIYRVRRQEEKFLNEEIGQHCRISSMAYCL
ncbi:hypothetical protein ASPZODRAFT_129452 [Penicilliopsis zonata CBS 506.65]|uniref:Subtelomeric hrmA-associated cluster protein AFUB-079030/YDR124W-like helical bundle domain-containing protein n=1 Tax=Penicilliopsis zonata CBS 506.65 TaxID=1073090 RepID=A0A1L9SPF0_9EURO|nr:hypothetical protein ASPZODRAFT_129452 [Penicilliopsis zonata CBS 506.65]OJJ49070.1 hypothetical protein ASPZODRAFT_129452 [Penicilliopsis zonata CBS 506.65]